MTGRVVLRRSVAIPVVALALTLTGCGSGKQHIDPVPGASETGTASYYGGEFHGRQTASGEIYDQNALTAAHRTLPFGTMVRVTNLGNQKSIVVRINDRGPFKKGRIIDLSYRGAKDLDFVRQGLAEVAVEVINDGKW